MSLTPLQKRRERVRHIRRRVVGAATALFLTTTGGIVIQLVSGHDPALASQKTTQASTSTTSSSTPVSTSSSGSSTSGLATPVTSRAS
jgi:hypothetical protein